MAEAADDVPYVLMLRVLSPLIRTAPGNSDNGVSSMIDIVLINYKKK